jgi:glutamate synthase (NADPH/NADH) small chain
VILAMGFIGVDQVGLIKKSGVEINGRGNVSDDGNFKTTIDGIFTAGDMRTGQSIVVKAINEGRNVADKVNEYLSTT